MSGVRLLVGTRKGAFILESDGTRRDWTVSADSTVVRAHQHAAGAPKKLDQTRRSGAARLKLNSSSLISALCRS